MALDLANAANALKEFYLPGAKEQLNNDTSLLNLVEKNTKDVEGKRAVLSPHVTRNSGVGARPDGGTLPSAGQQGHAEQRIPLKFNYGRIKVTGPTIRAMRSDRGSFKRAVSSEMKGVVRDLKRDVNRQMWGNSDGKIATCGTTSSSTTVTLASTTSVVQMRQLEVGMKITIGTAADVDAAAAERTINSVDVAAKTFVISGAAITTSASHFVFRSGSVGDNAVYELEGLQKIVDDSGTLHNVDPSTYASWVAVDNTSGSDRSVTEPLMAKVVMDIQIAGGEYPTYGFADDGTYRAYGNALTSQKRFDGAKKLKGGYVGLDFIAGGPNIPITWERDTPAQSLYFLNLEELVQYEGSDWDWMDEDGAVLSRVSGEDAYEATLFKDHELGTEKRNAHGRIRNLIAA